MERGPGYALTRSLIHAVAMESAMLAPNAQVSLYPWKDVPEKIPLAVRHIRKANRPATEAMEQRAAAD